MSGVKIVMRESTQTWDIIFQTLATICIQAPWPLEIVIPKLGTYYNICKDIQMKDK